MALQHRALPLGSCIPRHRGIRSSGITLASLPLLLQYRKAGAWVPRLVEIQHIYF